MGKAICYECGLTESDCDDKGGHPRPTVQVRREGRTLHFTGLPVEGQSRLTEVSVSLRYVEGEDGDRLGRAITLDNVIIPLIVKALGGE
jgi:hypothetical protein